MEMGRARKLIVKDYGLMSGVQENLTDVAREGKGACAPGAT